MRDRSEVMAVACAAEVQLNPCFPRQYTSSFGVDDNANQKVDRQMNTELLWSSS